MLQAEDRLDDALRAARAEQRDQRRRQRWTGASAASYAVDTLFLALYAVAGTVPGSVAAVYGACAALICGFQYAVYAAGWNLKARDPNLTQPFILVAIAMNLGVVAVAPQVTFPLLANQFTIFAFGMIWLSVRDSRVVWTLAALGLGIVLIHVNGRIGVPASTRLELALTWAYFSLVMGRCLMLSVNANEMRARLADSRGRLAASLEQVKLLASHDELTRCLNRRALMARLAQERDRSERSSAGFAVALIDLDHFKRVNDDFGHAAGDAVLAAFSETVRQAMRAADVFGRYGGEEFLLVLTDSALNGARDAVERIRAAVAARDWGEIAPRLRVTVSAGVALYRKGDTIEQLLKRADDALYGAKRAGRDRIVMEGA